MEGVFNQLPAGGLIFGLRGSTPASYATLTLTENATVAGTFGIQLEDGYQPSWGDTFTLLNAPSIQGALSAALLPTLADSNLRWWYELTSSSLVAGVRHFADFNHDGAVNTIDLTVMLGQFGSAGAGLIADIDGNGSVNTFDLTQFLGGFGLASGSFNAAVPAPSGVAFAAVASCFGLRRRR